MSLNSATFSILAALPSSLLFTSRRAFLSLNFCNKAIASSFVIFFLTFLYPRRNCFISSLYCFLNILKNPVYSTLKRLSILSTSISNILCSHSPRISFSNLLISSCNLVFSDKTVHTSRNNCNF